MSLIRKAFKQLHYPVDIIAQCFRWYRAYALNPRNLEEMVAERGIVVDHSTLHRWVSPDTPNNHYTVPKIGGLYGMAQCGSDAGVDRKKSANVISRYGSRPLVLAK